MTDNIIMELRDRWGNPIPPIYDSPHATFIVYDVTNNTILNAYEEGGIWKYSVPFNDQIFVLCAQGFDFPSIGGNSLKYYDEKFWLLKVGGYDANDFRTLDHFTFTTTIIDQKICVPFLIRVEARDVDDVLISDFNAVCALATIPDNYDGDTIAHYPPFCFFRQGVWSGIVTKASAYSGWVRITTAGTYQIKIFGGGKSSLSNYFTVS